MQNTLEDALTHIRYLAERIGGRGSTRQGQREAAVYVAMHMQKLGLRQTSLEKYRGARSTYRPFALAFLLALAGVTLTWLAVGRWAEFTAAACSALAAWGMLRETDIRPNWMRLLLPTAQTQNTVGVIPSTGEVRRKVVLCAHLDTHRTPIFYSSPGWNKLFSLLVGGAFASMVLNAFLYLLAGFTGWSWLGWLALVAALMQVFALGMCLHADFTPFSPGANDDASGVGIILALARHLTAQPLAHTEVWIALTDNEETGAQGINAFLNAHAAELGADAVYIILDMVGRGKIGYITEDGLIRRYPTHPRALELARTAAKNQPKLGIIEHGGLAYTDALACTQRRLVALTLDSLPPPGEWAHWHAMTDTVDNLDEQTLSDALTYTWELLRLVDRDT